MRPGRKDLSFLLGKTRAVDNWVPERKEGGRNSLSPALPLRRILRLEDSSLFA